MDDGGSTSDCQRQHTFKLLKSQLGWTAARVRHPAQAVRWTWLLIAAYVQPRLAWDTKTEKSKRTLRLPERAAAALREHKVRQAGQRLLAGGLRQDRDLVFCTSVGTPLDAANVRRAFKKITNSAGLGGDSKPLELRTSFVSLMSGSGVPVEEIARLVGHASSRTTEVVYYAAAGNPHRGRGHGQDLLWLTVQTPRCERDPYSRPMWLTVAL